MRSIRRILVAAAVAFLFMLGVDALITSGQEKKPDPPAKLEATKAPSAEWLKGYDEYLALQGVILKLKAQYGIDKLEAELNKEGGALASQIPQGYSFDQEKKQFVVVAKPAEPAKK